MCTAATYRTKDFYFGRTLDYEFSYGEEVTVMPRNYPFHFREAGHDFFREKTRRILPEKSGISEFSFQPEQHNTGNIR